MGGNMPEISHEQLDEEIDEAARGFKAAEHRREKHVPLSGPNLVRVFAEPQLGVEQGALFTFDVGDRPEIVMLVEKVGERLRVQLARLTAEKVEVFHNDNLFSDLENNYVDQML